MHELEDFGLELVKVHWLEVLGFPLNVLVESCIGFLLKYW